MRRVSILAVAFGMWLGHAGLASAQVPCRLDFFSQLPLNTALALGPTVYTAAVTYPQVATAIVAARDAWDGTDAVNRLGDWSGVVTSSDCPAGQPFQIGAFNFKTQFCQTVTSYGAFDLVAFVDYFTFPCAQCGTKSMSLNLFYMFSDNPQPGQFDIQSIMTHEFGHMLGLRHMFGASCVETQGAACPLYPDRNTMTKNIEPQDTCERTLSGIDVSNANASY